MDAAVRRYDQHETRTRPQRPASAPPRTLPAAPPRYSRNRAAVPAALLPSMRSAAYSETNAPRPTKATERHTTARESRTNDAVSSVPAAGGPAVPAGRGRSARSTGRHSAAPATAGSRSSGVSRRPPTATTAATVSGARAKPRLPPSENQPIAA
ncbi:hypothetical protein STENM223S_03798 [Streptomyces tendae]